MPRTRVVLQERQRELLQRERQLALELQQCLAGFQGADAHAETLRQVATALDELFLLVIVGEFNAGKSAFINALLHTEVMEVGVIPTTSQVTMLRYGEQQQAGPKERGLFVVQYPADFLQDLTIVDTPGTNAVLREHERLTEDFVPRSDLILFITSTDRPFTESERAFMERIRAWGKKVVVVLNKIDLLPNQQALDDVMDFIRDSCKRLLGFQPQIFPISALQAQQSRTAVGQDAIDLWESSRFSALENYLFNTLDEKERVRLKLLSPLGVMQRLLDEGRQAVEQRAALLAEDARTVENIEQQLQLYRTDMEENFKHRLGEIENIVLEMRERGDRFFDDTIRFGRIFDLMQGQRIRAAFDSAVISDNARRIDETVQELIDWLVEQEHRLWQDIMEYLERRRQVSARRDEQMIGSVSRQFDYNRRALLQSVARTASEVVKTYDEQAEAAELSQELRSAVTLAATASVGGIGLGAAIVALIGTLAADVTGILAGSVLLALGLYVIPAQRTRAKRNFNEKVDELRTRLHDAMNDQFNKEMNHAVGRVRESLAPYTRFVRAEQQKAGEMQSQIDRLNGEVLTLRGEIEQIK